MMRSLPSLVLAALIAIVVASAAHADEEPRLPPETQPVAVGTGGGLATIDGVASREGVRALRRGGNAVDAAVVTAAVLGVTEPYVEGLGGTASMTIYLKKQGRAIVLGDRAPAPQDFGPEDRLNMPGTGPIAVGVPTTLMTWKEALDRFGTISLRQALQPAIRVAREGFVVEEDFVPGPLNRERFRAFQSSYDLFFGADGELPVEGTLFRNPDLARAYKLIADGGVDEFYDGPIGEALVETIRHPPLTPDADQYVGAASRKPGEMQLSDVTGYEQEIPVPAHVQYRGYDIYSTPPPDGGSTLGEALNILEGFDLSGPDRALALHRYLEASKLAYADRERYVGDPRFVDVPLEGLLSQGYADERRCLIGDTAMQAPVAPGDPTPPYDTECSASGSGLAAESGPHSTHHFSVADGAENMVSYTGTLVFACGSGVVVTGYGFCLNNEMSNFNGPASAFPGDPNQAAGGKRPRGNLAPTVMVRDGQSVLTIGAAGGQTIQTTVLGILLNHLDFGMPLPEAITAPRATQRNTAATLANQSFLDAYGNELSSRFGHTFTVGEEFSDAMGVLILPDGRQVAAGEPWADARVVNPGP